MTKAYDYLSDWFEILNDDCDYPKWSQYFIERLSALGAGKRGLELGCGSGAFSRALTRAGYVMTGGDISLPMLTKAQAFARDEGLSIDYILCDAATVKAGEKFDFIIAPNDCYNYLPARKLPSAFSHAASCLRKGGIFWFDLSSEHKLRTKVANNMLADDRDEITYLSFNSLKDDHVETDVTLFVRGDDGKYDRYDERHTQYIHGEEFVVDALKKHFRVLCVEGHLGENKEGSDRLNFLCVKE